MFNKKNSRALSDLLRYATNFFLVVSMIFINFSNLGISQVKAAGELYADGFSGPFGMAFDQAGYLYVANEGPGGGGLNVSKVASDGTVFLEFSTNYNGPSGVAFNSQGELFVSDDTNRIYRVNLFDGSKVEFINGNVPDNNGQILLENPNAIAFDSADTLYVANAGGYISVFDSSGLLVERDFATGFATPQSIVVDEGAGVLYTSDFSGQVYQVDKSTGVWSVYADTGRGGTQGGLVMDSTGNLFYSAYEHGEVLRIDPEHRVATRCIGGLTWPRGLAFDSAGWLYVTDYDTGQILRYDGCNPAMFSAWPAADRVEGRNWPYGEEVSLTINGSSYGTQIVGLAEWDPYLTFFSFDLGGVVDLQEGDVVTVSSATATKTHTVTALTIGGANGQLESVFGTAEPGSQVNLSIHAVAGTNTSATADSNGSWTGYFDPIFDLVPGTGIVATQHDEDGDWTHAEYFLPSPPVKVGLVLFTDPIYSNLYEDLFNLLSYQGLLRAQSELGVVGTVYEPANDSEYELLLNLCAEEGNELCFAVSFLQGEAIANAAAAHPETAYAILDGFVEAETVRSILFAHDQVGYLAGTLAGLMTGSNKIGEIGGMQIPPVETFMYGYQHGAQCANLEVEVLAEYTGVFDDPAIGSAAAQEMLGQGADVIFAPAGPTGYGAILTTAQSGAWAIGVDVDQYLTVFESGDVVGAEMLLTSAMKNLDVALFLTVEDFIQGHFFGGVMEYDLASGGVGLAPFHEADSSIPQGYKDQVLSVQQGIMEGWIDISDPCREEPPQPEPYFSVIPNFQQVHGHHWPLGETLTLQIYDPANGTGVDYGPYDAVVVEAPWDPGSETWVEFNLSDFYANPVELVKPGNIFTVSGGGFEKTHKVKPLFVNQVDPVSKTIAGTAEAGSEVRVDPNPDQDTAVWTQADASGSWSASNEVWNIHPYFGGDASQWDEDGDSTQFQIRLPLVTANPVHNWVNLEDFNHNTWVTISIFRPEDATEPFFEDTRPTDNDGHAWLDGWEAGLELEEGDRVIVTDNFSGLSKSLLIEPVVLTEVDLDNDVISGTAPAGRSMRVEVGNEFDGRGMDILSGEESWEADFSTLPPPEGPFDLTWDMWPSARLYDDDFDASIAEPGPPFLHVVPYWPEVHGHEWAWEAYVTLTITDSQENLLYEDAKYVWDDPWCGEPCFDLTGILELESGMVVSMTDGETTRTVVVTELAIADVNPETDTVSGTALPGAIVQVDIHEIEACVTRFAEADLGGMWTADFSTPSDSGDECQDNTWDLDPGSHGRAIITNLRYWDNGTLAYWSPPVKFLGAAYGPNPVAIEQAVSITASFEGDVASMQFFIPEVTDWIAMTREAGADESYAPETGAGSFYAPGTPGVYPLFVSACNTRGECFEAFAGFLAVYDPNGGFVTGGGQIIPGGNTSYDDDYLPNIDGSSPAVFGFNVKYKKGSSTVPSGHILFQYRQGNFKLQSSQFDWLVVTNSVWGKFQGLATIDGMEGLFPFRVDARDSDKLGGNQDDRLIIRIWAPGANIDHDQPIYRASGDVQGQIVIHDKKDPALMLGGLFEFSSGLELSFGSANAVRLAVEQANQAEGVLGSPITLFMRDAGDGGHPDQVRLSALDLIENRGVSALLGPGFSPDTQAILEDIVVPSGVVLASPSNTGSFVASLPDNDLYFRMADTETLRGRAAALRACELGKQNILILHDLSSPHTTEIVDEFSAVFAGCSIGGKVQLVTFGESYADDYATALAAGFDGQSPAPDMVFMVAFEWKRAVIMVEHAFCQADSDGKLAYDRYWSFPYEFQLDEIVNGVGDFPCEPPGTYSLAGYEEIAPAFYYDLGDAAFWGSYQDMFGAEPTVFANLAYDAAALVILAAEEAGSVNSLAIRDHLYSVSSGGTPVSDLATALGLVRQGVDIDWQGTFERSLDGLTYLLNHDFEPGGETISPYLVRQAQEDDSVSFVAWVSME